MVDDPMVTVRISEAKREQFKLACLLLGMTMTDVLRGAVDATIAEAKRLEQYSDRTEYVKRGGRRVRVTFDAGEEK